MEAYQAALSGQAVPRVVATERTQPGTMSALIVAYYNSTEFKTHAESTRYVYRHAIERFRSKFGEKSIAGMQSKHVREYLDEFADKPGVTTNIRRVLNILMGFAVERNYRPDNPMKGLRKSKSRRRSEGFRAWTDDDIATFEAYWPAGSRERLALALLLYTAQRRSDVVKMGRQHVRGGKIHVAQQKGGGQTKLWIPLHPKLAEAIRLTPADHLTFLITRTGGPFTPESFTNWFAAAALEAGLPPRSSPHGLRKAGARRLAEAGCTQHQIKAITGHKTLAEVALYTESVDQERLADQAMAAVEESEKRTSTVKPSERV
ncbi:tyrosine-type recombinase/integrase [Phenylobacterium sp.]|uniref:tyrosine-type recombinase/integrase n=1 Tax=Phenylobacterium sp. TaxID=1871053 RepID=UPI002FCB7096